MSFGASLRAVAPWYMQGRRMGVLLDSVGAALDGLAERSFLGRCASIVHAGGAKTAGGMLLQCEPDVLPMHANDRQIQIYPSEPIPSQRLNLARWRQLHARRGTHRGELERVQPYFLGADGLGVLPRMRIVHQDGAGAGATWHTLAGSYDLVAGYKPFSITRTVPSNWDYDGQTALKSRFWAIIYTEGVSAIGGLTHWDDGSLWNGGQLWDGIPRAVLEDIVAMFQGWHSAHSDLAGVILARDLADFDPTATAVTDADGWTSLPVGNWGQIVDPVTGKPTRLPTATWIFEKNYV